MIDYKIKSIEIWDPTDFRPLNHLFKWSINLWVLFLIFPLINDLPITIPDTLFLKASLGVITLDWSFALSPGNLIPGVTINKFLYFFLTIFASCAEHTIPAAPDFFIRPACFNCGKQDHLQKDCPNIFSQLPSATMEYAGHVEGRQRNEELNSNNDDKWDGNQDVEDILDEDENSEINPKINQLLIIIAEKQEELSHLREDDPNYNSLRMGIDALLQDLHHMEEVENNSLISRLTNVKEKVLNAGSNAISKVSEVANKSLENKFSRKEDNQDSIKNETDSSNRVEPSFFESSSSKIESTSSILDQNNNLNEHGYDNIPSFLKRNRD